MKQREIKPCCFCGQGVMHSRQMTCTKIVVQRHVADIQAISRQDGLEKMLGGCAFIANAMGPDEDLLIPIEKKPSHLLVCDKCALTHTIAELWEKESANEQEGRTG